MWFWFGLLLAFIAGLLSIGFSRNKVTARYLKLKERHVDIILIILLVVGLLISAVTYLNGESEIKSLKKLAEPPFLSIAHIESFTV